MYVTSGPDEWEAAMRYDHAKGVFMAESMSPKRKALCDGEEHYCIALPMADVIETVRVLPRAEVERDRTTLVPYYYGSGDGVKNGYLPCFTNGIDAVGVPDPHDMHASILTEVSKPVFDLIEELRWHIPSICTNQKLVDTLNEHVRDMWAAQASLDVWEEEYRKGGT